MIAATGVVIFPLIEQNQKIFTTISRNFQRKRERRRSYVVYRQSGL